MTFLEVFKSRGFWIMLAFFVLFDLAILLVMREFRAYWTGLVVELVALLAYSITRALFNVDEPVWFLKKKIE